MIQQEYTYKVRDHKRNLLGYAYCDPSDHNILYLWQENDCIRVSLLDEESKKYKLTKFKGEIDGIELDILKIMQLYHSTKVVLIRYDSESKEVFRYIDRYWLEENEFFEVNPDDIDDYRKLLSEQSFSVVVKRQHRYMNSQRLQQVALDLYNTDGFLVEIENKRLTQKLFATDMKNLLIENGLSSRAAERAFRELGPGIVNLLFQNIDTYEEAFKDSKEILRNEIDRLLVKWKNGIQEEEEVAKEVYEFLEDAGITIRWFNGMEYDNLKNPVDYLYFVKWMTEIVIEKNTRKKSNG